MGQAGIYNSGLLNIFYFIIPSIFLIQLKYNFQLHTVGTEVIKTLPKYLFSKSYWKIKGMDFIRVFFCLIRMMYSISSHKPGYRCAYFH